MTGCFSLFKSHRSAKTDTHEVGEKPSDGSSTQEIDHAAHPSCAYCGPWETIAASDKDNSLPSYSDSTLLEALSDDQLKSLTATIHETIQTTLNEPLRKLSLDVHANPELGYEEYKTHDILVNFMRQYEKDGWKITPHAFGLKTAWSAVFTNVPQGVQIAKEEDVPTVGFNSEEDALPGIGHACGHNLIAIGGVAGALSVAAALRKHNILGRVHLLGTPAEEGGGGKIVLQKNGAYKGLSACFMIHPAPSSTVGAMIAVVPIVVTYKGKGAHAGMAPWEGVNAQDAAVLAYNNISALRQQLHPSVRVHGIIQGNNWAPNVIPSESKLIFNIRTTKEKGQLQPLKEKIFNCFKAAALATNCEIEIEEGLTYADVLQQSTFAGLYQTYMREEFKEEFSNVLATGSTDFGNISYAMPTLQPLYRIPVESPVNQNGNHTPGFTKAAKTVEAHKLTLNAAEGIAILAAKVLLHKQFREQVWKEWKEEASR
ncbi:unnamed protein product [Sympodiomycopsis kandeliae]